jgi:hypothetical protein
VEIVQENAPGRDAQGTAHDEAVVAVQFEDVEAYYSVNRGGSRVSVRLRVRAAFVNREKNGLQ